MAKKSSTSRAFKGTKNAPVKAKTVVNNSKKSKASSKKSNLKKLTKKTAPKIAKVQKKKLIAKKASKPAPKALRVLKKPVVSAGPKGYNASEYQKFLAEKKRLDSLTNQQLKDILRKNMQSMSGNKDDLIYKVADGIVLGRIPRCPKCFGGRPKFDFKKGTYYCSGYRDDEDFKNCHTSFQLSEIKRDPWQ